MQKERNILNKINDLLKFRDSKKFKIALYIFIGLVGIYFLYIYINVWMNNSNSLMMFSLIPIFFLISFLKKNDPIFLLAELITIGGDVALMLNHKDEIGFPIYIFVQIAYAMYFYFRDENIKRKKIIIILRVGLSLLSICIGFIVLKDNFKFTTATAIIYFLNILINLAYAIIFKDPILIVGFALFVISDAVIGLNIVVPESSAFGKFLGSHNWIHVFYLPSQAVLIFNKTNNDYSKLFKKQIPTKNRDE